MEENKEVEQLMQRVRKREGDKGSRAIDTARQQLKTTPTWSHDSPGYPGLLPDHDMVLSVRRRSWIPRLAPDVEMQDCRGQGCQLGGSGLGGQPGDSRLGDPQGADLVAHGADLVAQGADPIAQGANPVAQGADPVAQGADPVGTGADPVAQGADPVAQEQILSVREQILSAKEQIGGLAREVPRFAQIALGISPGPWGFPKGLADFPWDFSRGLLLGIALGIPPGICLDAFWPQIMRGFETQRKHNGNTTETDSHF